MKHLLATLLIGIFLVSPQFVPPAQAGWFEFFFPTLRKKEVDVGQTLQAPFLEKNEDQQGPKQAVTPANIIPMDRPHYNESEVSTWVMRAASEVMNYHADDYKQRLEENKKYFTSGGYEQYKAFLTEQGILTALESGRYTVRSFVESDPLLLNEGPVSGYYRWLFEVPVMLSRLDSNAQGYKDADPLNMNFVLVVQLGRVPAGQGEDDKGVLIERWSGKTAKK